MSLSLSLSIYLLLCNVDFDASYCLIGDFSDPRPPEEADIIAEMTQSQLLDTSVLDNDPATTDLLMQLFLSDLTPEEELNKQLGSGLGVVTTPPTMLDVDRERSVISTASSPTSSLATVPQLPSPNPLMDSGLGSEATSPSPIPTSGDSQSHGNTAICDDAISALMFSASPLECTDSNGFNDPLDNPFLTESTDFSDFLQDPSVLNSVTTMLSSTTNTPPSTTMCSNDSDTTPFPLSVVSEFGLSPSPNDSTSNTDVPLNVVDTHTHDNDLDLFDLSQSASLIPPSFDATEVENLDIDFSVFCADTLSLVPTSPDDAPSVQLSVLLTGAQPTTSTSSTVDLNPPSVASSNSNDVFIESSPSPSTSDQLSVADHSVKSPKTTNSRKRKGSNLESDTSDSAPDAKKTKLSRRQKNNVASQVSRAKRRAKNSTMFDRVGELESENAMLRIKEKELSDEIERLKKLLVHRLSQ